VHVLYALELLKTFGEVTSVGPSLGSFSLSGEMLTCLLEEFKVRHWDMRSDVSCLGLRGHG